MCRVDSWWDSIPGNSRKESHKVRVGMVKLFRVAIEVRSDNDVVISMNMVTYQPSVNARWYLSVVDVDYVTRTKCSHA